MRGETLPLIFGLKLRQLREDKGYGLKTLSERVGLSASYLNEIEKGKKYPKADKILQIAEALDTTYDEMVSLRLDKRYGALGSLLESPLMQGLPLSVLGLTPQDVLDLVTRAPRELGALVHTLADIAAGYDMQVEHFFYAMLRAYQIAHDNYFEEIEEAADRFRESHDAAGERVLPLEIVRDALEREHGVTVEPEGLAEHPELAGFRSVWVEGPRQRLLLNPRLSDRQKAFQIGREIGYRELKLGERGITSSRSEPASFEQVLNDFRASYYAGAIMLHRERFVDDLRQFLRREVWDGDAFLQMVARYDVTPEMFLYRMTQILPRFFRLSTLHFYRVTHETGPDAFHLTKQFAMGGRPIPAGVATAEHYCRRWAPLGLLRELAVEGGQCRPEAPLVKAQRARFLTAGETYWTLALARPLALHPGVHSCVVLGFLLDEGFRRHVRCWNDPAVPLVDVNPTCERCDLPLERCAERAAPDLVPAQERARQAQHDALERLKTDTAPA